jgi:hypothetical protein
MRLRLKNGTSTGLITVQLPYALEQQIQMIFMEGLRTGSMTMFIAGLCLISRTPRI